MTGFTPFEISDPLPSQDDAAGSTVGTQRLRLVEGLMLSASHFEVEQLYHRSRLSRLLTFLHGQGTVCGLDVTYAETLVEIEELGLIEVKVSPGLAVDAAGRLIELRFESCLVLSDWMDEQAADSDGQNALQSGFRAAGSGLPDHVMVDVLANFATYANRPEPAFATGNADRIDSVEPSLSIDSCRLDLVVRDSAHTVEAASEVADAAGAGTPTIDELHDLKRQSMWDALTPSGPAAVHLARLAVPVVLSDGNVTFDSSFNMLSAAVAPNFDGRRYSYSAAELALIDGIRR